MTVMLKVAAGAGLDAYLRALVVHVLTLPDVRDELDWCAYARSWLDGSLVAGRFHVPGLERLATLNDWVGWSVSITTTPGAGKSRDFGFALEDIARCARHVLDGYEPSVKMGRACLIRAARHFGVRFSRDEVGHGE